MSALHYAPVLLTVFNRPHETRQVLERLRQVQPQKIFIAADGPRNGQAEDLTLCKEVRRLIKDEIDWHAEVITDFSSRNLGLRRRMVSAITWALEHEDRVIVLEDDCIPNDSFFRFSTKLLDRYADDQRIGVITGNNFQPVGFECDASYYFSRYPHCWGWATWRRAWNYYDDAMSDWIKVRESEWLKTIFCDPLEALYWKQIFDDTHSGKIESWAYRWTYSCWRKEMLTITPAVNLVTNIGIGNSATNTRSLDPTKHKLKNNNLTFPLKHTKLIGLNSVADNHVQKKHFGRARDNSIHGKIKKLLLKIKILSQT